MEDRLLLSVSALFVNGELFVSSDGGDSLSIRQNVNNRVEIVTNGGVLATAPNVLTSAVTKIVVVGGDDANVIDLSQVTNATYPNITNIRADADDGNDLIVGSPSYADQLFGENGDDTLIGQAGNDTLDGGDGNDLLQGQDGDDSIIGEDGSDSMSGDLGNDTLDGGDQQDSITGDDGDDLINAGLNDDLVSGGNDDDTINGMEGLDTITGDAGDDSILGGAANDLLAGNDGNDTLLGQAGVDNISGDAGDDSINGGEGNDNLTGNDGNDIINGAGGHDVALGNQGNDTLLGGSGQDTLTGDDTLTGGIGNDLISGQGGNDLLRGGGGNDALNGGDGDDVTDSNDPLPEPAAISLTIADVTIVEGDTGSPTLDFVLTLSGESFLPISVSFATADGFAIAGSDYNAVTQTVTFAPGITTATVSVPVIPDVINEIAETVRVILSNPVNVRLQRQEAFGTLTNDDAAPIGLFATSFTGTLFLVDPVSAVSTPVGPMGVGSVHDIDANSANVIVGLNLGNNLFSVNSVNGVGGITQPVNGLPGGIAEGDIAYDVNADVVYAVFTQPPGVPAAVPPIPGNPNLFRINPVTGGVTDVGEITTGATPANIAADTDFVQMDYLAFRQSTGTLFAVVSGGITGTNLNFNDALISINPLTAVSTLVGPLGIPLAPGTGAMEFDEASGLLYLLDGVTGNLFTVNPVTGAATPVGGTGIVQASGLAFAENPARPPRNVSVADVTITEGDIGQQVAVFAVTVAAGPAQPNIGNVTVDYTTATGTATSGVDFVATSGSLTFGPQGGTQFIPVFINGDFSFEAAENFFLQITNATGAVVADSSGIGTITNDDLTPLGDTHQGGLGNDTIIGGPAGDVLNGDGGNDSVVGNDGDDTILGGIGPDTLNGGNGNDSINGQGGADVIDSGDGDDIFVWEGSISGNDTLTNASGADGVQVSLNATNNTATVAQTATPIGEIFGRMTITDGAATITLEPSVNQVTVDGGAGDDTLIVSNINRVNRTALTLRGGLGNDVLNATGASTGIVRLRLEGGVGDDTLLGSLGGDTLVGEAGIDRIRGGAGNDLAIGGLSIDSINGEDGNDTLLGGDGSETLLGDGADTLDGDAGDDSIRGEVGNDLLIGDLGNDTIRGGDGNDTITGDAGNDSLLGDTASDSMSGGDGDDTMDGGRNNDFLNGNAGNDKLRGDHGEDSLIGGNGNDTINGGDGDDVISGQSGADLIGGFDGDDTVNGGTENDTIAGGDGDDSLVGDGGRDLILGEQGDDLINGQGETDTLSGGQGDDTLVGASSGEIDENFILSAALLNALNAT